MGRVYEFGKLNQTSVNTKVSKSTYNAYKSMYMEHGNINRNEEKLNCEEIAKIHGLHGS